MEVTANFEEYYTKYKPLLKKFSFKYYNKFKDFNTLLTEDDYFNISYLGLHKAVLNYKPDKGANFLTYAHFLIEREIRNELFGRSSREIGNKKLSQKTDSLYERASAENDEFLVLDTLVDEFSFKEIDTNIDNLAAFNKVLKAMKKIMTEEDQDNFLEYYYFNSSFEQIAAEKGVLLNTIKSSIQTNMNRLRQTPTIRKMRTNFMKEKLEDINEKLNINSIPDKMRLEKELEFEQNKAKKTKKVFKLKITSVKSLLNDQN